MSPPLLFWSEKRRPSKGGGVGWCAWYWFAIRRGISPGKRWLTITIIEPPGTRGRDAASLPAAALRVCKAWSIMPWQHTPTPTRKCCLRPSWRNNCPRPYSRPHPANTSVRQQHKGSPPSHTKQDWLLPHSWQHLSSSVIRRREGKKSKQFSTRPLMFTGDKITCKIFD